MAVILGTVAHWSFDGDSAIDEEGALPGILNGNAAFITEGETDTGISFGGNGDTFEVAHDPSLALAEGSFSIWINPDTVNGRQGILSKDSYGYADGGHIGLMIENGGTLRYRVQSSTGTNEVLSNITIAAGEWSHVTISWGADGMQIFINGELAGSGDYTGGIENNEEPLLLGANQWGSQALSTTGANDFFSGSMDGFGVYDHQLTAGEIADVMAGIETPNEAPTLEAPLADLDATEEAAFTFTVPAGTFADADGDTLALEATLADGSALPEWLSFDGTTFSGTPDDADVGAIDVTVTASDGRETAETTFTLTTGAVNDAPIATDDVIGLEGALTGDIDLLENDTDADDAALTITAIDGAAIAAGETVTLTSGASVTLNENGTVTYGDGTGVDDAFTYTVTDGAGASDEGGVTVLASAPPPPPPSTAVAEFNFEEGAGTTTADPVGGLQAVLNGAASFVADGQNGFGIDLAGNGSTVEVAHDASMALTDGSFSLWVNPDTVNTRQGILSKDSYGYADGGHIGVMIENGGTLRFRVQSSTGTNEVLSNIAIAAGEWSHVTISWGADGMQIFINGELAGSGDYTGGIENNEEPLLLGANQWGSQSLSTVGANDFFSGSIDGFGIHDHQLSAGEIADVMAGVVTPNEAPTLEAAIVNQTATEEAAFSFEVPAGTFADADGNVLTLSATLANGSALPTWLSFDGTTFSGTPDDADVGAVDVTVIASDGRETAETTFTLTIDPVNDAPIAVDDTLGLNGLTTGDIDLVANDTDADDAELTVTAIDGVAIGSGETVALASGASVTLNEDGTVTYGDGTGVDDTFTYTVTDGAGASDDGEVAVSADLLPPPPPPPPATDSAVAFFGFEEGAGATTSDTQTGLQGLLNGAASFITDGQSGSGIDLPGNNSTVEVAHDPSMALAEGSFAIWVNPDGVNSRQGILSKDSRGYDDGGHIGLMVEAGGLLRYRIQSDNGTNEVYSDTPISANEWSLVVVTWGDDGMQIFVNGELVGTGDYTGGIENNEEPLLLGANQWGSQNLSTVGAGDFFNGQIDGFGVYDRQLTTEDVAGMMDGVAPPPPGNNAPVVTGSVDDIAMVIGQDISVDLPSDLFTDIDGDALTITATLADGSALPEWLSFDGQSFTGSAPEGAPASLDIEISATDGEFTATATATANIAEGLTLSFAGTTTPHAVDLDALIEGTPLKIMTIGDSLTVGTRSNINDTAQGDLGGYRDDLFNRFAENGVLIDYVGDYAGAPDGSGLLDGAHQGVGGRKSARVRDDITVKTTEYDADIVLLIVGTNDVTYDNEFSLSNYPNQVTQMIQELFAANPDVHLFLSTIPPVQPDESIEGNSGVDHQVMIDTLNDWIRTHVAELQGEGNANIHLVDIAAELTTNDISTTDIDSGVHPTEDGYGIIAEAMFNAINSVFSTDGPILDGGGNDVAWNTVNVVGGDAMDMLLGNDFDNVLEGGAGNDWLDGGAGDDVMTGGAGTDVFVMSTGDDLVTDFSASNDIVDVSGHGIETLAEFIANSEEVGSTLVFTDPETGDTITLEDTSFIEMTEENILFTGEYNGGDDGLIG